jgi:hypothetical protein
MAITEKSVSAPPKYIVLTLVFSKEGNVWVGVCKELGTAADGETFEEVTEILRDMVILHFNTLEDVGECERFLKEHGIEIYNEEPHHPIHIPETFESDEYLSYQIVPIGAC